MLVLAFDTSTPVTTVAVVGDGVAAERSADAPNRHAEVLLPLIDRVLHDAGAGRLDIQAVAVGAGPGPFTGLRVGLVTAATLSDALQIPAYAECSLDIIAAHEGTAGHFVVATDARRRELYWAAYSREGTRVEGPRVDKPDVVTEWMTNHAVTRIAGTGTRLYGDMFTAFHAAPAHPHAVTLALLVTDRARARAQADPLTPLYLRRPDAVPPGRPKAVTPA